MDTGKCSRCKDNEATVLSRRELFCQDCFIRFICGKQRKHMGSDRYKVKFSDDVKRDKVILPMSYGKSSLVLLDILISMFEEQTKNPRAKIGFEVDVVHINDSKVISYQDDVGSVLRKLKNHYALEKYPITFTDVGIESILNTGDVSSLTLHKDFTSTSTRGSSSVTMDDIFEGCPNRASKKDILDVIVKQLIERYAVAKGATSILWAHSMTSLADEVIALTVKGRGSEIFKQLTDGVVPFGESEIDVVHPLRDCSLGEIEKFVQMKGLEEFLLVPSDSPERMMNKQKTINEVVENYFKTVDSSDDNIVSTVVKTGAKLGEPRNFDGKVCSICNGKIYNDPMNWLKNITHHSNLPPETEVEKESLREWLDMNIQTGITDQESASANEIDFCYGCAVTVGGFNQSKIEWPVRRDVKQEVETILSEFIIDEE